MAPGWDPRDFELGDGAALAASHAEFEEPIRALTCG